MTFAEALHSRLVTGLRIVLPLGALALLSTLFLVSRDIDPSRALPFAAVDVEDLARDPRITAPRLSGVTDDGTAVTLTARTVRIASGTGETIDAEGVVALFEAADGRQSIFSAETARMDRAADRLSLQGDVRMHGDAGYRVATDAVVAALDRTWVTSPGPVTAEGPAGRLEAGGMLLRAAPAAPGEPAGHRLLFTGGVRLLYQPEAGD